MDQPVVEFRPGTSGPTYRVSSPEELGRLGFGMSAEYVERTWGEGAAVKYLRELKAVACLPEIVAATGVHEGLGLTTGHLYQ